MDKILLFIGGVIVGFVPSYILTRRHYQKYAEEKIEEIRHYCCSPVKMVVQGTTPFKEEDFTDTDDLPEYMSDILETGNSIAERAAEPYTISDLEYGNDPDYSMMSLTYYEGDDILADEQDDTVELEETIGRDALRYFGEYEPDVVFVRNEKLMTDYEVFHSNLSYRQAVFGDSIGDSEDE